MDVLCKSVGVLLAVVRAAGAVAPSRGPAAGEAGASLTGAGRDSLNGVDPTWRPVRGPARPRDGKNKIQLNSMLICTTGLKKVTFLCMWVMRKNRGNSAKSKLQTLPLPG